MIKEFHFPSVYNKEYIDGYTFFVEDGVILSVTESQQGYKIVNSTTYPFNEFCSIYVLDHVLRVCCESDPVLFQRMYEVLK